MLTLYHTEKLSINQGLTATSIVIIDA